MQGPRAGAADGTDGSARPGGRDPGGLHAGGPDEGERLDVLLINPALHTLTAIPPLGLGYLAATTRAAGYGVELLDLSRGHLDLGGALARIVERRPRVVGLSVLTPAVATAQALVPAIRREVPDSAIVVGGAHVSSMPARAAREMGADYGFRGEADLVFPRLVEALVAGGPGDAIDPASLPGVAAPGLDDAAEQAVAKPVVEDLDALPFPAWDLIAPATYPRSPQLFFYKDFPIASVMTTRGCPYQCSFCATMSIHGFALRRRSPAPVVDEIEMLVRDHGVREINITDDNFTFHKPHALAVCEEMIRRGVKVPWKTPNGVRIDAIDDTLASAMKRAGCYQVAFGIESGSQAVLDRNLKHLDLEIVVDRMKLARRHGLETAAFFILGLPGETEETVEETIRFAEGAPLDYAHFSVCLPLPGSKVFADWEPVEKAAFLENPRWEQFLFFNSFSTSGLDATFLKRAAQRALGRFYRHPRHLWKIVSRVKPRQYPMLLRFLGAYFKPDPRHSLEAPPVPTLQPRWN